MVAVTELGYVGIGVSDLDEWRRFGGEIVGMEVVDEGEDGCFYLRMDAWHHRVTVHRDGSDDLLYLGLRVAGPEEFAAMQVQLSDAGIDFRVAAEDEARERRVLEVLKLEDPAGVPVEVFHGPEVAAHRPFHPARGMHGRFKTGTGGMGHCLIRAFDTKSSYRFYRALGMRGSVEYRLQRGQEAPLMPVFMHCNDRDHTVAFGLGGSDRRINHIMVEVDHLDDVGLTHDLVVRNKIPVTISLGKHSNDHMFSFYFQNPSGWVWEYGWGARPASEQSEYYTADVFGHRFAGAGF